MASIFTFDPNPPRVSSPWPRLARPKPGVSGVVEGDSAFESADDYHITRLEPEPQDGPTEYKLHLLLRPRRRFLRTSAKRHLPGSYSFQDDSSPMLSGGVNTPSRTPPPPSSMSQPRQHRLEQLTTQLLWRLQQSSPYHASSATNLVLPTLPEATPELAPPKKPAKLLQGLEESNGALYEIGVSDDGTLVGLADDEMEESLNNLRAMAASLGCSVKVLRKVEVGECEWVDEIESEHGATQVLGESKLFVAEAFVKPELQSAEERVFTGTHFESLLVGPGLCDTAISNHKEPQEQLRVTLTGATTSGKSSLLGTLSTSTLDNGRGKSRLSLLKHRHEIVSGVTSSVAQELIGYTDSDSLQPSNVLLEQSEQLSLTPAADQTHEGFFGLDETLNEYSSEVPTPEKNHVINYASQNVSSWSDVHVASQSGRLVLISDSAGHPRYRRTTVRGLVGWAPHWTMVCIAANEELPNRQNHPIDTDTDVPGMGVANSHLSIAHLELCLQLNLRLVVVLTKLDTATKMSLRHILSTILTVLKNSGRVPLMLHNDNSPVTEADTQAIPASDLEQVQKIIDSFDKDAIEFVPILLTSAVRGTGIGKLHALLRLLPIPSLRLPTRVQVKPPNSPGRSVVNQTADAHHPQILFHIEDVFHLSSTSSDTASSSTATAEHADRSSTILSGILAQGDIPLDRTLLLGPFSITPPNPPLSPSPSSSLSPSPKIPINTFLHPRTFASALARATSPSAHNLTTHAHPHEWRPVRVLSARNLRLPVHTLRRDQVGTLAVALADASTLTPDAEPGPESASAAAAAAPIPARKGMVLIDPAPAPKAAHTFTALFPGAAAAAVVVGSLVVVYCASVRASAKVIAAALHEGDEEGQEEGEGFHGLDDEESASEDEEDADGLFGSFDERASSSGAGAEAGRGSAGGRGGAGGELPSEAIAVTFQFVAAREWVGRGAQVLVMPGGGPGLSYGVGGMGRGVKRVGGLDGFVGRVVETFG